MLRSRLALPLAAAALLLSMAAPVVAASPDASVSIGPSAVNEVGHPHTFTVTVTAFPGGATPVSFDSITPSVSPTPSTMSTTCGSPTINGDVATCTVTINSSIAAAFTANVTAVVTMGGVSVTRSTSGDPGPGGSGPATKSFVDASVSIGPAAATNLVGAPHTFTVTVTAFPGGASPVSFNSIAPSISPTPSTISTTCGSPTVNGNVATCTITINSATAGTFTANVGAQVTIGGVTVHRSTDGSAGPAGPGGSGQGEKHYAAPSPSPTVSPSTSPTGEVEPDTATVPTSGPNGTGTIAVLLVLLLAASAVALGFAIPKRRRHRG